MTCERCGTDPFEGCDGTGLVPTQNGRHQMCRNLHVQQLRRHLGPEIAGVRHVQSPLLRLDGSTVVEDMTKSNLWLQIAWPDLVPHLKWVFGLKGLLFNFKIVTDVKIKSVFVGAEAYRARATAEREDRESFNTLEDLVGKEVDLLLVKLGYLGHKNIAAAGAIKEALMVREVLGKPTWMIEDTRRDHAWVHSRSEELEMYMAKFQVLSADDLGVARARAVPAPPPTPRKALPVFDEVEAEEEAEIVETLQIDFGGAKKKKKGGWGR